MLAWMDLPPADDLPYIYSTLSSARPIGKYADLSSIIKLKPQTALSITFETSKQYFC
jgi:hypothetical protein